jgi:hypothetical protein
MAMGDEEDIANVKKAGFGSVGGLTLIGLLLVVLGSRKKRTGVRARRPSASCRRCR